MPGLFVKAKIFKIVVSKRNILKYLSLDLEATGLRENDLIIELAMVPFDSESRSIETRLSKHWYVKCPSFESLKPNLDQWVITHNEELITKAHSKGLDLSSVKEELAQYLTSNDVKDYFFSAPKDEKTPQKIVLFGKSMNAIDLPFLSRDFSWNFMRDYFHHQILDLSSIVRGLIDMKLLPPASASGSGLMKHLGFGEVAHTALEDAINTAKMYLKIIEGLEKIKK